MTSTPVGTPIVPLADAFFEHLAARDFERLASLFEPDVHLRALLPDGLHEWHGVEQVVAAFVGWFGHVDECSLVATSIDLVGPRLQLAWRARVCGGPFGDASFVVEQVVHVDPGPSRRVLSMSMLCSGFVRERRDV